jgi:threonine aldolase
VGSVLVGSKALIEKAKRPRKMLGGAMRQSGLLAAACLYALDHNIDRLAEDHDHAARLGAGLGQIEQLTVESVATNMLFVRVPPAHCAPLQAALAEQGVQAAVGPLSRFVLHMDVSAAGVDRVIDAAKAYFAGL